MSDASATPIDPPEQRLGFLIYRAGIAVARAYETQIRPSGFSPPEVGLLTQLASHGPSHVRELSRALGVSPQTVVNLSSALQAKGMLNRSGSAADRRAVVLAINDAGRTALARADALAREFDSAVANIAGADAAATVRVLRRLLNTNSIVSRS